MSKRLLGLCAAAALTASMAAPAAASGWYNPQPHGHAHGQQAAHGGHQGGQYANRGHGHGGHQMSAEERRALQIRKECQMYGFRWWRFHPDYRHCTRR